MDRADAQARLAGRAAAASCSDLRAGHARPRQADRRSIDAAARRSTCVAQCVDQRDPARRATSSIQDGSFTTGVENYKEFWYALVGLAGEGQNFDGNGTYVRFQTGGGSQHGLAGQARPGDAPAPTAADGNAARRPPLGNAARQRARASAPPLPTSNVPLLHAARRPATSTATRRAAKAGRRPASLGGRPRTRKAASK